MVNPITKYIDKFLDRRIELKATAGKLPPIPKEDPLKSNPLQPSAIVMDWFKTFQQLYRHELDDWQVAREKRYHPWNPYTYLIQQLYKDSMLDSVLYRQIDNRILRVTNKSFLIKDKNGDVDLDRTKFVTAAWFRKMVKHAIRSKFYGYSLVYINRWKPGEIQSIKLMDREHVIPERGILLKNYTNYYDGLVYGDYPNHLIYMELGDDAIGLLDKIAPLTILKRHSWASWDEFEQIFGIPLRIARTANKNQKHLDELENWMVQMGSASFAILDKMDEVDVKENKQTDAYQVFDMKRKAVNEEICIAVNGQTMTTLQGSSRSQSETHIKTQDEITDEDIQDVVDWFNDNFIHVMRNLGYDLPEGYALDIIENSNVPIEERHKIDLSISQMGFQLDTDYIENTYNVTLNKENPLKQPAIPPADPTSLSFFH